MIGGVGLSGVGYGLFGMLWVLSRNDKRFQGAIDRQTITLFVCWFFLCCVLTYTNVWAVGNVAHLAGAALGALLGAAIGSQGVRKRIVIYLLSVSVILIVAGASIGRRYINLSSRSGQEFAYRAYREQEQGHAESAARLYRKALEFDDRQASWWYNLGIAYQTMGEYQRAFEAYEQAVRLDPKDTHYREARKAPLPFVLEYLAEPSAHGQELPR